ncbi:MAG: glucoamylase [Rhodospirillales bacterium 20-60-12]|nr:MAG: glucoamylase [Rhodospirillales bacterium 20-60-12]HQT66266.1 glycoside hydrolase family 15 protein [Acetobacteraceae bacterium]
MALPIEDYAIIGNCETMALVGRDGSIDWLGMPRFDSAACFAGLLGTDEHGHWRIAPQEPVTRTTRQYRGPSLILETIFETAEGSVCVTDCMSRRDHSADLIRCVKSLSGRVTMCMDFVARFDYGSAVPWVTRIDDQSMRDQRTQYVVGPDRLILDSDVAVTNKDMRTMAIFTVAEGDEVNFCLTWSKSYHKPPARIDIPAALTAIETFWQEWTAGFRYTGQWPEAVLRSLITLKALSHWETGGIVAAGTTSLPEQIGGPRNWDYRYCWLRDTTLTLYALMQSGFTSEAAAWREWLLRAVAGNPEQLQIMYGIAGERRLDEWEIPWLPGYENSAPVRIGNAASGQVQLDVYGEVMDALYLAQHLGLPCDQAAWNLQIALIGHLATIWDKPDDGIWEMRGGRQHFTHSKVMAWVALDRAIRTAEEFSMPAPIDHWHELRQTIHDDVCKHGFNAKLNHFTQAYDNTHLDASLLMIPLLGFLPADDERVIGTVAAIERNLLREGFVLRYDTAGSGDGLPAGEGAFLACSFWLADTYVLMGRIDEAQSLFEKLLSLCNEVGLLSEEYDPALKRQVGNFPQAFSHIALINTAFNLAQSRSGVAGPAAHRSKRPAHPRKHSAVRA